jgi:hypothetical protein
MRLEKYLVLNKFFLNLFGQEDFKSFQKSFQDKLRDISTEIDSEGRTNFINAILRFPIKQNLISEDDLLRYDSNIQSYVRKINYRREPITLKYFQYLALLFSEIFLDNLKNNKDEFLHLLNSFLHSYREKEEIDISDFQESDLSKLAFWMATGSGKTLIMHINYLQFLHYNLFSPDNILLITPNEGLSKQHYEELQKSGIPAKLYSGSLLSGLGGNNEILVIEMTKFVEEKKGGGVTLPVSAFEGRNLVFVDEGHKGKRSEEQKWAKLRNEIGKNGFVFEYSATFGQILDEKNKDILNEYAKSILYDYSYKYFYLDGYGKDFTVLNIRQMPKLSDEDFQETMFIANLLSYYEQLLCYENNPQIAKESNLEKPLWIFVGTTVTGKEEESDVLQILDFLRKTISNENWLRKKSEEILKGNYRDADGKDIFEGRFSYLRQNRPLDYEGIYRRVFGGKGALSVYEIKNATGELGLKVGDGDYFGVVNIGDVAGFKKQMEKIGLIAQQDVISSSLFDDIKRENSKINILIGSKKFIEGWDTWRVSSMGLLNIGRGEGPQIIQLFGRGVRIKGKNFSLQRSEDGKSETKILETLNIYSIKADYLQSFLKAIQKEEVEYETIHIPVKPQHREKWKELYVPSPISGLKELFSEDPLRLLIDEKDKIFITIDLTPKITYFEAEEKREGIIGEELRGKAIEQTLPNPELLDWERIYQEICSFKLERGYYNLFFSKEDLKSLIYSDRYKILASEKSLEIKKEGDLKRLEDLAILVIKKYIDSFYRKRLKEFELNNLRCDSVEAKQLPLFAFEREGGKHSYEVQVDKRNEELVKKIRKLAEDLETLLKDSEEDLPRLYLDEHLFVPLLIYDEKRIDRMSPVGLVPSEKKFLEGLRDYLREKREGNGDREIYLLRNFPQSGVGFQLDWGEFYPDFIMWIKEKGRQIIVFLDPKGLVHIKSWRDNEKVKFAGEGIKRIEEKLGKENIKLHSFILSDTPYNEFVKGLHPHPYKEELESYNILFLDDSNWADKLFRKTLSY